jgi:hypothetical protein
VFRPLLQNAPFDAFRFETKGTNSQNCKDKPFEFVLVDDSSLATFAATADPQAFAEHLDCSSSSNTNDDDPAPGCVFTNLGGDATLVAPKPLLGDANRSANANMYGHCAAFVRGAPTSQIVKMWRLVAQTFLQRLQDESSKPKTKTVWFSTAGTGIAWLHFRFDDRPKYYRYQPFAKET